jgi:hypothetical protein
MKLNVELSVPGHLQGGHTLTGRVVLVVVGSEQQKFRSISVTLSGRASATVSRTVATGDTVMVQTMWQAVDLVNASLVLAACADHEPYAVLGPGAHNFDFAFPVSVFIPPSFARPGVWVRYSLLAEMAIPGVSRRVSAKTALFSPGTYNAALFTPLGLPLTMHTVKDEKRFFMGGGDCLLTVEAPSACRQGERMRIVCKINNFTKKTINSVTVKLVSKTWCELNGAKNGAALQRWGRQTFAEGATAKMSQKVVEIDFDVPVCPASLNLANFIFIDYALHVQVDVSFAGNLRVKLPISVTTSLPPIEIMPLAMTIAPPVYTILNGTGANTADKAFSHFESNNEVPASEEKATVGGGGGGDAPAAVTVLAPQASRLRGATVAAGTTMPAEWAEATTAVNDAEEKDGMVQCFFPGCGALFASKSAFQAHSIAIHAIPM